MIVFIVIDHIDHTSYWLLVAARLIVEGLVTFGSIEMSMPLKMSRRLSKAHSKNSNKAVTLQHHTCAH